MSLRDVLPERSTVTVQKEATRSPETKERTYPTQYQSSEDCRLNNHFYCNHKTETHFSASSMSVLGITTQTLSDIVLKVPLSRAVPKLVLSAL